MVAHRVIVTRPAREAQSWVERLRARGIPAVALPLIEIRPWGSAQQRTPSHPWSHYRALMFVSGNAVRHFFDAHPAQSHSQQAQAAIKNRVWSPGPGTTQALLQVGMEASQVDAPAAHATQFDSEALWAQVGHQVQAGDTVLIVRGGTAGTVPAIGSGRDWLARKIEAAGGQVEFLCVYERCAPTLDAEQQALARAAAVDGSLWLLSSSEAVHHLLAALPEQPWQAAHALATHPRIAQTAREAGFGQVLQCRPALEDVVASIESAA